MPRRLLPGVLSPNLHRRSRLPSVGPARRAVRRWLVTGSSRALRCSLAGRRAGCSGSPPCCSRARGRRKPDPPRLLRRSSQIPPNKAKRWAQLQTRGQWRLGASQTAMMRELGPGNMEPYGRRRFRSRKPICIIVQVQNATRLQYSLHGRFSAALDLNGASVAPPYFSCKV